MMIDSADFREKIYLLICDDLDTEHYPVPESKFVKSEFSDGSYCAMLYDDAMDAYSKLCKRLKVEDQNDLDIEIIINDLLSIGHHLSLKMFEYGVFFAQRSMLR